MNATRVLIADSLHIFRAGVRNLLARERDFEVAEAASLGELVQAGTGMRPDIALVDLGLPPHGGAVAVQQLAERIDVHAILWSFQPTRETVLAGIRAGAHGFLHKEISPEGLMRALRGAMRGEAPLSRELTSLLVEAVHDLDQQHEARERLGALSQRELEVLELVAGGARNKQIAAALTISEFTVKRHVQNILEKLAVASRRAAAEHYAAAFASEELLPEVVLLRQ